MNILYLLHVLKTKKLSELVANIDAPPLDINLAIWEAIDDGQVELDEEKDLITPLKTYDSWYDPTLATKLITVIQHYAKNETNITRGRLASYIKDPMTRVGYKTHEYLMTLEHLIETGQILEEVVAVPATKKRPYHKFVFLCLEGNPNEEWNAKAVNKWIADFEKSK